jgi:hypothetical protein
MPACLRARDYSFALHLGQQVAASAGERGPPVLTRDTLAVD